MRRALLLFAMSCAGPAAPPAVGVAPRSASPAEPTCADVGVILRGEVTVDDPAAGPAREREIQGACETDHWAPDLVRCVTSTAHPTDCLDRLTDTQHAGYTARLRAWSDKFGVADEPAAPEPVLTCEDGLHNSDSIRPVLDDSSPERTWQSEIRHRELVSMCERAGWNPLTRQCLAIAATADALHACLEAELDPAALDVLDKRLANVAATAKSIATLRQTPAKVDCKHVVDAHYADAKWQGKGKPEERKASRNQLLLACTNEHWDELRRACMIVDSPDCAPDLRWAYPALSSACEWYAIAIEKLGRCTVLPKAERDALKQAFDAALATSSPDAACAAGANAVIEVLKPVGC